jgi:hypothetical protein
MNEREPWHELIAHYPTGSSWKEVRLSNGLTSEARYDWVYGRKQWIKPNGQTFSMADAFVVAWRDKQ